MEYLLGSGGDAAFRSVFPVDLALWIFRAFGVVAVCALLFGAWRGITAIRLALRAREAAPADRVCALLLLVFVCMQAAYALLHVRMFPHYAVIFYPSVAFCVIYLWTWASRTGAAVRMAGQVALVAVLAAHVGYMLCFFAFVASAPEKIDGDYGMSYRARSEHWQTELQRAFSSVDAETGAE